MADLTRTEIERRALTLLERLSAHADDEVFRSRLLKNEKPEVIARVNAIMASADVMSRMPTDLPGALARLALAPPDRFGVFRVVELLGSGGMGEVWRGERDDGLFEQIVAIKVIQSHLQVRAGEAFEIERRILARLEHPNIARLIDGGATDDGRACLVMEYVDGQPFDEACAGRPLAQRVDLFRQVLAAVHYAHGRMIAHGDLKPNNILVDRDGRVRLLDFGIARFVSEAADSFRLTGAVTSSFASPARLRGEPPSIPDDVFALGRLMKPVMGDAMDSDLRAIARKACAEHEDARYATASDIMVDLIRWEGRLPVSAAPRTGLYLARKFAGRSWKTIAAVAALIDAVGYGGWSYTQAHRAHAEVDARFDNARSEARYLLFTLYDQLAVQPRSLKLCGDVAAKAQHYLNILADSPSTRPEVKLEAAQGLLRLAQVQGSTLMANLGQPDAARQNLDAAQRLLTPLTSAEAREPRIQVELEAANLAEMVEENQNAAWQHIKAAKTLIDADPDALTAVKQKYYVILSIIERWNNQFPNAKSDAQRAITLAPADTRLDTLLLDARAFELRGDAVDNMNAHANAEADYVRALSIDEHAVLLYPTSYFAHRRLSVQLYQVGIMKVRWGNADQGLKMLDRAVRESRANVATQPDDDNGRRSLNIDELGLAQALAKTGHANDGLSLMQQLVDERKTIARQHPDELRRMRDYALGVSTLADMEAQAHRMELACLNYGESRRVFDLMDKQGRLSSADRTGTLNDVVIAQAKICKD